MKKATALLPFKDLKEGVTRNMGDSFICDDERATYLQSLRFVSLEEFIEEKTKKAMKKKVKEG